MAPRYPEGISWVVVCGLKEKYQRKRRRGERRANCKRKYRQMIPRRKKSDYKEICACNHFCFNHLCSSITVGLTLCACVRAYVRVCVRACVRACAGVSVAQFRQPWDSRSWSLSCGCQVPPDPINYLCSLSSQISGNYIDFRPVQT